MNVSLEFRLLYDLDDDWADFHTFYVIGRKFLGPTMTNVDVAGLIRQLADSGLIELGSLADNEVGWERWDVSLDEAMRRIAEGYRGEVGYDGADANALMGTEVVRANLTRKGELRLAELEARGMTYGSTVGSFETRDRKDGDDE